MYRTVEFKSTFTNDWHFDANGNALAPGARKLAETIVARLQPRLDATTDIEQHSYYGWAFRATYSGHFFYNVLNPASDLCFLTVQCPWQWFRTLLLRRPPNRLERYCNVVSDALSEIPEVSGVSWQEYRR
ncbi:MAG TPA: hypothetical protein VKE95_10925 [Burkholderiales bacterium]|nr:hypothetical protein [Burkholderiales bacterium]